MQQKFMFADFTLTKVVYKTLKFISFLNSKSSLLHSVDSFISSSLFIYINDIFDEFRDFDEMFNFLRDHFFSRIEWAHLKLSFKKLKLFMNRIKALNVVHVVEDQIYIVSKKIEKIAK